MRFIAVLCLSPALFAFQAMTGSLSGGVSDPSGAMIAQAIVVVASDTGGREVVHTDEDGRFTLAKLPGGRYAIEVRKPGFAPYVKEGIELPAGSDVRLDVPMQVGAVVEVINVVAPRPAGLRAATPRQTPQRIRVGGNVQASRLTRQVNPAYPETARQLGIEGSVMLSAVIGTDGSLLTLQPLSHAPSPDLVQSAMDAVRQWRYTPTLLNGVPVEVQTTVTVNFRLQ